MVQTANIASLNLVKSEVDATLTQVEGALESYVDDRSNGASMQTCMEGLEQVWGAMRLAAVPGADELAGAILDLFLSIKDKGESAGDSEFAALGNGVMVLGRYLEYVQIKQRAWPQLLLPTINQILRALGRSELPESQFLDVEMVVSPPPALAQAPRDIKLLKRIRQMYQTGLMSVLRDTADTPHFRLMSRALARARQQSGDSPLAALLWVGEGAVDALATGVAITASRKTLLGQLDREIRKLVQGEANAPLTASEMQLLRGSLYLVGLSEGGEAAAAVKEAYEVSDYCLSQQQLTEEYELMCGPGGSVIKTVASVLKDEMAQVKDTLDIVARGAEVGDSFSAVADQLVRVAQTLVMLGLIDASQAIKAQSEVVRKWQGEPAEAELNALVDVLMSVDNAVAGMVRQVTPGVETPLENSRISIHQLDEARAMLVAESRSGLSLAKRAISSYLEASHDLMHLANVPSTLNSVAGGMSFLNIPRGAAVLSSAALYIEKRLLGSDQAPDMHQMETLADAISSVDYYLESLEANKPLGDGILDVAEGSVADLGFPVKS